MRPPALTNDERNGLFMLAVFAAVLAPFFAAMWQIWAIIGDHRQLTNREILWEHYSR